MEVEYLSRQAIANLALGCWIGAEAVRVGQLAGHGAFAIVDIAIIAALAIAAIFVLIRPAPKQQDGSLSALVVALAAAVCPFLYLLLPGPPALPNVTGLALQVVAVAIMLTATLVLGRNYSIVPQYRWLVSGGPYAFVRHPLYASYLVFDATLAFQHPSALSVMMWLAEAALFDWRARREEGLLAASDPAYLGYAEHVRWRFIPYVI